MHHVKKHDENPLARVFDDFRSGFGSLMNHFFDKGETLLDQAIQGFNPKVDIREDEKNIYVDAEVPGLDEKDLNVEVRNNTLILKGEKKYEKDTQDKNYHRIERSYGSFHRELHLPEAVITDQIKASYKKGVLTITIPKDENKRPKKLKISVES